MIPRRPNDVETVTVAFVVNTDLISPPACLLCCWQISLSVWVQCQHEAKKKNNNGTCFQHVFEEKGRWRFIFGSKPLGSLERRLDPAWLFVRWSRRARTIWFLCCSSLFLASRSQWVGSHPLRPLNCIWLPDEAERTWSLWLVPPIGFPFPSPVGIYTQ